MPWSLSFEGPFERADAAFQDVQGGLVVSGCLTELCLFDVHFNRVAVERVVQGDPVHDAVAWRVLNAGHVQRRGRSQAVVGHIFKNFAEFDIARFVVGRIGVRNVFRKHLHAVASDLKCQSAETDVVVDAVHFEVRVAVKFFSMDAVKVFLETFECKRCG